MSVSFCGLELAHPVINASGTFDLLAARGAFGEDALVERFPFAAFVSKTVTAEPRAGNPAPRLWEAAAGLVNSIGLPNKGIDAHLEEELPAIAALLDRCGAPLVTNVMGSTAAEIAALLARCEERSEIAALELNVSCPNVKTGLDIGADPAVLAEVLRKVRPATAKPLIVKLTPNTSDVAACARAAQDAGADAVSLINTLRAAALSPSTSRESARSLWLGGATGGLSGPAIRAVALAQVATAAAAVSIPIIGMGGIQSARHAQDLLDAGATLVAIGTESFRDPLAGRRVAAGLARR